MYNSRYLANIFVQRTSEEKIAKNLVFRRWIKRLLFASKSIDKLQQYFNKLQYKKSKNILN